MKLVRRTTMLALILLATSATLASASSSLSGEYVTTVKTAGELNGTYRIGFSPGHFILHAPYDITGHGTYSISGSKITMHGPSATCTSAGHLRIQDLRQLPVVQEDPRRLPALEDPDCARAEADLTPRRLLTAERQARTRARARCEPGLGRSPSLRPTQ